MISNSIASALGPEGPSSTKTFSWFDGSCVEMKTRRVNFKMTNADCSRVFMAKNAYAVENINISKRRINWPFEKKRHSHLADLNLAATDQSLVTILIGRDIRDIHDILDYRKPPSGSDAPEAILTHFGWCIVGPVSDSLLLPATDNSIVCHQISSFPTNEQLNASLERFWQLEREGLSEKKEDSENKVTDKERRALHVLDSTAKRIGNDKKGYWEIGLMLKKDDFVLHNNRIDALRQLERLERRLNKNPDDAKLYHVFVKDLMDLKFCVEVEYNSTCAPLVQYYLPHHGVKHPHKPGKIRVVFNASSRFKGVSLNDLLLPGPNLMNGSVDVLIGLRLLPVAVGCDIAKHYHQVRVPVEQQSLLRFVYRVSSDQPIKAFQMTRHIFGAVSSPTTAIYALKRTAEAKKEDFPDAAKILDKHSYMDNILFSIELEEEAIQLCSDIKTVSLFGGFTQTQFTSSSKKVLASLDPAELARPNLDLDMDDLPVERTLGLMWDCEKDSFYFPNSIKTRIQHTKRSVLSDISSIFDPLGLILPVVLLVRILMQDIWRSGIGWDDELPAGLLSIWTSWVASLSSLSSLHIPRCIRRLKKPLDVQLHLFCDASEKTYGACAYLRADYGADGVELRLIMAKARVAPLRQQSIPRLELLAAVLAAQVSAFLKKAAGLSCQVLFWSDSQTVLQWIYSRVLFFHSFVSSRRDKILEGSEPQQWWHVPGELNPADDLSRGITAAHLSASHRWFIRPTFLQMEDSMWPPMLPITEPSLDDVEVSKRFYVGVVSKSVPVPITGTSTNKHKILFLVEKLSSLLKLKRCVAWLFRAVKWLNQLPPPSSPWLSVAELDDALRFLIQIDQRHHFLLEMRAVASKKPLQSTSCLCTLTPFIDHYGVLRVGGRLDKSTCLSEDQKHPILLHHSSRLARLIIQDAHESVAHGRAEATLAAVRAQYHITKIGVVVRSVLGKCRECRRCRIKPEAPLMASLPRARLQSHLPPFTHVGVDYFGPIEVIIFRRVIKRWGCLFTCLVTRAVQIEIAHTLDTVSFLSCFWRLCYCRGIWPRVVYSDNGSNFVATEKELLEAILRFNQLQIANALSARRIQWIFSPPLAPHFGGVWERLVKSAKAALMKVLKGRSISDEMLLTAVKEAEKLINSRPLTHVSLDPSDPQPLTPFRFLVNHPLYSPPIEDSVCLKNASLRRRYEAGRIIAKDFWSAWTQLYIPNVIERRQWLKERRNLVVGYFIYLTGPDLTPGEFPLGRVVEVFPGSDGVMWSVRVKTAFSEYVRPVARLALAELGADEVDDESVNGADYSKDE